MVIRLKLVINHIEDYWDCLIYKYGSYWLIPTFVFVSMGLYLYERTGFEIMSRIFLYTGFFVFAVFVSPATAPPPPQLYGDCSNEGIKKRKAQELAEARKELAEEREKLLLQLYKNK